MFGYINVCKDELKIKEYNVFRAYYCGLCKTQGKLIGNISRLSLSYDFAFLAILLSSLSENEDFYIGRCMLHPLKKRMVAKENASLSYCAFLNVAMAYYKIKDDLNDKTFSKKVIAYPFFSPYMKKIAKKYKTKLDVIEKELDRLSSIENGNIRNIDLASDTFGKIMEEIFDADNENSVPLRVLGYNIGKWLYTVDAIDDFGEDVKKGRYNPFEKESDILDAETSLYYNLSQAAGAYELLNIKRNKNLLDNLIYLGLKNSTESVINKIKGVKNNGSV